MPPKSAGAKLAGAKSAGAILAGAGEEYRIHTKNFKYLLQTPDELIPPDYSLGNGTTEHDALSNIPLFDFIHDFGGSRGNSLAVDSIKNKKPNDGHYYYDAMLVYLICKYSYLCNTLPAIPLEKISAISWPGSGQATQKFDDIENYCILLAMKQFLNGQSVATSGGAASSPMLNYTNCFKFISVDDTDELSLVAGRPIIARFFENMIDARGTNSRNLLIDTPGMLSKIIGSNKNAEFAYILAQESAHDASKKSTQLEPASLDAFMGNVYCEKLISTPIGAQSAGGGIDNCKRCYRLNSQTSPKTSPDPPTGTTTTISSNFQSNFTISFSGMQYSKKPEYLFSDVTYSKYSNTDIDKLCGKYASEINITTKCILNAKLHDNAVPRISTQTTQTLVSTRALSTAQKDMLNNNEVTNFYNDITTEKTVDFDTKSPIKYTDGNSYLKQDYFDFQFAKKRAGDSLQAFLVQAINNGDGFYLPCNKMGGGTAGLDTSTQINIQKAILVTIDRPLFALCIKEGIHCIFVGKTFILCFNPTSTGATTQGVTAMVAPVVTAPIVTAVESHPSRTPTSSPTSQEYDPATAQISLGGNKSKQYGGVNPPQYEVSPGNSLTEIYNTVLKIPFILFRLLPKLLRMEGNIVDGDAVDIISRIIEDMHNYNTDITLPKIKHKTQNDNEKSCLYEYNDVGYYDTAIIEKYNRALETGSTAGKKVIGQYTVFNKKFLEDNPTVELISSVDKTLNFKIRGMHINPSFNILPEDYKIWFKTRGLGVYIDGEHIICHDINNTAIIENYYDEATKHLDRPTIPTIPTIRIPLSNLTRIIQDSRPVYITGDEVDGVETYTRRVPSSLYYFFKHYIGGSKTKQHKDRSHQTSYKFETAKLKTAKLKTQKSNKIANKIKTNPPKSHKTAKEYKSTKHQSPTKTQKLLPKSRKITQHKAALQPIPESRVESSSLRFPVTIDKMPILNTYLEFYYSPDIILSFDPEIMPFHNIIVLTAYLNIFDNYETSICYDYEKYDEDFTITSKYEITNKLNVNLLFYYILQDFKENQNKICYGLLEYCIQSDNILSIDFETQMYYVYCSYISRPYTVNSKIKDWIENGTLLREDPIFQDTIKYFNEIRRKIKVKITEINIYIQAEENGKLINKSTEKFINTYLSAYGFLNMTKAFMQSV